MERFSSREASRGKAGCCRRPSFGIRKPASRLLWRANWRLAGGTITATLLPDGKVLLWGGVGQDGSALPGGELYDPESRTVTRIDTLPAEAGVGEPRVEAFLPGDGATAVPVQTLIALRFSQILSVMTVNRTTVRLSDDAQREVAVIVVPAERGMLVFLTPD